MFSFDMTRCVKKMTILGVIITIVVILYNLWYFTNIFSLSITIVDSGTTYFDFVTEYHTSQRIFGTTHCGKIMPIYGVVITFVGSII